MGLGSVDLHGRIPNVEEKEVHDGDSRRYDRVIGDVTIDLVQSP
jgi:hypothetical protein